MRLAVAAACLWPGLALAAPCNPVMPVSGEFSSGFGPRGARVHTGVDLRAPIGSPVVAAAAGRVVFAGRFFDYGLKVEVEHPDGSRARYAHLAHFTPGLRVGAQVARGQPIGALGRTGRVRGTNLHVGLRRHGMAEDPWPWLTGAACNGTHMAGG